MSRLHATRQDYIKAVREENGKQIVREIAQEVRSFADNQGDFGERLSGAN